MTSEKFWIQLGMGVGTAALAVMAVAATPFTLSTGAIGAIGFMTFTSTGELYDYEITYDHNTEEFVKGKGYANIHQYLGGFAFKNMLAGYSGYQIGNSIGSAIGGTKYVKSADDVIFNGKSVDKAFGKHGKDFGSYPDGSKTSVKAFTNDVKRLIDNGTQVKGTYRTTLGTHIYNPSTKQWAFINADGTFNTAFKLSDIQYKYLIETGVIK